MAGPRDWVPEEPAAWLRAEDPAYQRYVQAQRGAASGSWPTGDITCPRVRRARGALALAFFALALGAAAIWTAVTPLLTEPRGAHEYVLSSVGLVAVLVGINALRRNRFMPSIAVLVMAVSGIGAGAIGIAAMLPSYIGSGAATSGGALLPPGVQAGAGGQPVAASTQVELTAASIAGAGTSDAVVGNGGSVRLEAGYSIRSNVAQPRVEVRLERRVPGGAWSSTGVTPTVVEGSALSAMTPPYSTSAATESVQYRFVSGDVASQPASVVYENQRFYTGMAATIYGYAASYCPTTAVHVAALSGREAGQYSPGGSLILVDSKVGVSVNLAPVTQRSLAVHECSHELQWLNYGSTHEGYEQMKAAAAADFSEGDNGAPPIEHAADCGAMAAESHGYLGYGGYCTPEELSTAARLLDGGKY